MVKLLLLLSLIMENTFEGLENECYDIDKVVEDISEIIRSVWTLQETTILATFDSKRDDKITVIFNE